MINKIVGYSGFQSYAELPYSTLKPGKEKLPDDKIWENSMCESTQHLGTRTTNPPSRTTTCSRPSTRKTTPRTPSPNTTTPTS